MGKRTIYYPADYTENIRRFWEMATDDEKVAGAEWYPSAYRIADGIGQWSGLATDRVAAMVAALSPRNPWKWNVQDAAAFAFAIANNREMPTATTFGQNRRIAWNLGRGESDWRSSALKVRSFVANIMGDENAVTVDVWAVRVATNGEQSEVKSDGLYVAIAEAYRMVAADLGISPRTLQATTWLVAERLGVGSKRRGRHSATLKRGTFPIVAALLGQ